MDYDHADDDWWRWSQKVYSFSKKLVQNSHILKSKQ